MSYSDLLDHVDNLGRIQNQSSALAGAMMRSHGTNADSYARLKVLEKQTGTPASHMIEDPELAAETQRKVDLDGSKWQLLSSHAPKTSAFTSEGDNAALMGDDLDNASLLEKAFGVVSNSARSLAAVPWSMSQGLWAAPRIAGDLSQALTKPVSEFTGLPDFGGAVADWARSQQKGAEATANKIRGDRSRMGLMERGVYSGLESFGQNLAMLPLTIASGGSTLPMLTGMSAVAGGQAYGAARDKNISPLGSLLYGTSQGAIEYATEMIPAIRFVNDLKLKSSLGTMARNLFGAEVPGEQIATLTGDLNEWAILNPDKPFSDYLRERPSAAAETLVATIVGTGSMVMAAKAAEKTGYSVEKYQQAQLNKNFMLALGEFATESKLLKRLPEKFQELVGRLKEGGDIENVYQSAEHWRTYWQEQNVDPAEMADNLIDGGSAQYVEALAAGGDLVIPLEVYAAKLAATEHHAALIEHSRLRPGDATAFEASQFGQDQEQLIAELQQQADEATANRPSHLKVYDDILGQLQGIGYDRKTAEQYATITAVRAKQRAAVLGKDAFELYNESPLKIVRPLPEGVQRQSVDLGIDPMLDRLRSGDIPTDESVFGPSLLQFVRKHGVRDDRGDIKSMEADAARKPGQKNIIRKDGLELDRVRLLAVDEGYLPEGSTTADLLDKIDQELRGTPVYSNQVQNPQGQETKLALEELKQHLDQVGIDYNQLSNEQIRRELYQMQGGELFQESTPIAVLSGDELQYSGDDIKQLRKVAIKWYQNNLQQKVTAHNNDIGDVEFTSKGRDEVETFSANPDKLKLLPALVQIIEQGQYIGWEPPAHPRKDKIRKFHIIEAAVVLEGKEFNVRVEIGEDNEGNKFYDLFPDIEEHNKKRNRHFSLPAQIRGDIGGSTESNPGPIPGALNIDITPADQNVKTLFQGGQVKRGFFRSSPGMTAREIGILKDADLSTFIHESSHSWLEELKLDAARIDAPEQLKNDWATVAKWLGNTDGDITREQHEQFARGGEAYFMEGKAPSPELLPIMQRFKSWLTAIYKTLTGLNVKLNDDVRDVFDRLLASEEEIKQARQAQNMVELFSTAEDAGMTAAEFAAYRKQAAQAHVDEVAALDRKLMQEKAREQAQWWKDARAAMREAVEAEAHAAPVYRAIRLLSSGKMFDGTEGPSMKLDKSVLVKMYGEPFLKRLPRGFGYIYANEGGMHPDAVASLFGYDSGDALIKDMLQVPPVKQWIEAETDMRMRETYGDMLLDGTVADEAQAAIHGDRRADVMAAELRAIKRQQKVVKPALDAQKKDDRQNRDAMNAAIPSRETFQMAAAQIIAAKKIGDISPRLYLEAERRAGKKAFNAVAKKDWQAAAEAKQQQLLNHYLYREASKAQEQIDDIMQEYDKLKKSDEKLAKSRDINLVNAARAILNRYGIDKNGMDAASYLAQIAAYTPEVYQDLSAAIDAATQDPKPYKQLTMDEFLAVNDAVMNLWELSKRSKQIEIDGRIVNRDEVIGELNARMEELGLPANQAGKKQAVTKWEKFSAALVGVRAATTRVEAWVDAMDGGKPDGVFRRYIWNPVIDGVDKYRTAKQTYISKYLDLLKVIEKDISNEKIAAPELGYTFNGKQELLGALLHTGNESNMEKLLVGRQWGFIAEDGGLDTTAWDGFVNRMMDEGKLTSADFNFIQGVWDLLEEAKPLAQKAHKEMYGYYFSEVTANEFTNRFGTYRGGYAPAISDSFMNQDQAVRQEKEALESTNNSFMFPSTGRGFTKSRVTYNKPLVIDLRLVPSNLDKVLRFSFIEPRVKDVGRVVVNPQFREVLNQLNAAAGGDMLIPWLQRTARQAVSTPSTGTAGRALDTVFQTIRRHTGLQLMLANLPNAMQQFTGLALSATKVKPTYLKSALWRYVQHPMVTAEEAAAKSEFMASNHNLSAYDMQQQAEDILINPNAYEKVKDFSVKNGYLLQQITQHTVNVVTWAGAYDQAIAEGTNEKDAVRRADSAVRMTQGTFNAEDVSRLETGSPFVRAFTQFYTYFNMQSNLIGSAAVGAIREKGIMGAAPTMLKLFAAVAVASIGSELITMAAKGGPDPDDDELDIALKLLIMPQIKTGLAMVPFFGSAINYSMNLLNDKKYDDRISTAPFLSQMEATFRAPVSLYNYAANDGSMKMAVKDTLAAIGMTTGLPAGALGRPLGYLAGIEDGKYEPNDNLDLVRGLITGQKSQN